MFGSGIKPSFLTVAAGFFTTELPGNPIVSYLYSNKDMIYNGYKVPEYLDILSTTSLFWSPGLFPFTKSRPSPFIKGPSVLNQTYVNSSC